MVDFYKENNVNIYFIDEGTILDNNNDENNKMYEFLERNGPIDNKSKLYDEEEIKIFEVINDKLKIEENKDDEKEEKEEKEEKDEKDEKDEIINNNISKNKNSKNINIEEDNIHSNEKIESKKVENEEQKINSKENNENDSKLKSNINESENEKNIEEKKMTNMEISKVSKINELDDNEKIQQKLNEIKEREISLLEKKSEVLRRYLSENVLPLLAKGVLNVCQNMPDDPVEFLANYLLDNSLNMSKDNTKHDKTQNELEKMIDETLN